ncbi:hypothetical protein, partial [Salmonella enterica]|uniref:hypothetical protein n=1 Tax=Salmonella enterica TaxID=28901 RepID=UPI0007C82F69
KKKKKKKKKNKIKKKKKKKNKNLQNKKRHARVTFNYKKEIPPHPCSIPAPKFSRIPTNPIFFFLWLSPRAGRNRQ